MFIWVPMFAEEENSSKKKNKLIKVRPKRKVKGKLKKEKEKKHLPLISKMKIKFASYYFLALIIIMFSSSCVTLRDNEFAKRKYMPLFKHTKIELVKLNPVQIKREQVSFEKKSLKKKEQSEILTPYVNDKKINAEITPTFISLKKKSCTMNNYMLLPIAVQDTVLPRKQKDKELIKEGWTYLAIGAGAGIASFLLTGIMGLSILLLLLFCAIGVTKLYKAFHPQKNEQSFSGEDKRKNNKMAIASMVTGILSILAFVSIFVLIHLSLYIYFISTVMFLLSIILGIFSLAFGIMALNEIKESPNKFKAKEFAVTGIICSVTTLMLLAGIILIIILVGGGA